MNHACARCGGKTDSLTEHRSEVEPTVHHPECCPGGCDSPNDHQYRGDVMGTRVSYSGICSDCSAILSGLPDEIVLNDLLREHRAKRHPDPTPGPEDPAAEVVAMPAAAAMAYAPVSPIEITHHVPYLLRDGNEDVGSVEFDRGDRFGRLSPDEIAVAQLLGDAASAYGRSRLPRDDHDVNEFCQHVHDLQARVMAEAARRAHPEAFPR